ncbi:hypothetical protein EGJ27_17720 [Pseudomonas sp. v388]|uniref:hypothetical protein n=1 Tax=Pseudomonas sp. v388 TaxID=2479849 RepID=UPI000F7AA441|nr:hypothetical protein [Pseudomonas sp. v388]RRV05651.1 hypothetical protein EGJ27_17720 [Pseudomonas sp. v388]
MDGVRGYSEAELIELLNHSEEEAVSGALLYMTFNAQDAGWIQEMLLEFISSNKNDSMRCLAITCLGHTARIHGAINEELTIPALKRYLENESLAGRARSALDDIEVFIFRKNRKT